MFDNPQFAMASTTGLLMLVMNLTGGQIAAGLTENQKMVFQSQIFKWISIYAIVFIGTRDPWTTVIIGTSVVLILDFLLNEHSRFYILRSRGNFSFDF